MGTFNSCRKHPKHTQSPGVCSLCLYEKLTELTPVQKVKAYSSSPIHSSSCSSISSLSSSAVSSSYVSPHCVGRRKSIRVFMNRRNCMLEKRKSMAFGIGGRGGEEVKRGEGKNGFLSKFLVRRNKGLLMHSKSTREGEIY